MLIDMDKMENTKENFAENNVVEQVQQTGEINATKMESEEQKPVEQAQTEQTQPQISAEQLEELKAKAAKADEHWERLLRVSAEFDNYRKRTNRERQEIVKFANETLIKKLLPVLDNFEAAMSAINSSNGNVEALISGVSMIQQQLKNILAEVGLEEINALNQPFDHNLHEAISEEETTTVPPGYVLKQLRKGYKLNSRMIRPALVVVAKAPSSQSQSTQNAASVQEPNSSNTQ